MRYRQDLQVALRNRYARLLQTGYQPYGQELRLVRDWIAAQPALAAIVRAAVGASPDLSVDEWLEHSGSRGVTWPDGVDERSRAALVWLLMSEAADGKRDARELGFAFPASET